MRKYLLKVALILLSGVCLLTACGENELSDVQTPSLAVELVSPSHEVWPDRIRATGEILPWQEAIIGAEVSGVRIEEVLVNVGDLVKKGQLLARLDQDTLKASLSQFEAQLLQSEAQMQEAQANAAMAEELGKTGSLSEQQILRYRTASATAKAQYQSARAQLNAQATTLQHTQIVAPDKGVISSRSATVGAVVNPGSELFRLILGSRLEWRARVRADVLSKLSPGMTALIQTPDGNNIQASLRKIAPMLDSATRNGLVYFDLQENNRMVAGQFVSGDIELGNMTAIALPETCIVLRDGNSYVMQVDNANLIHEVKVSTGRRYNSQIEILEPEALTGNFVILGGAFLHEGDLVEIAKPSTQPSVMGSP